MAVDSVRNKFAVILLFISGHLCMQNKDDEFVKNQQQNIGDAIQLLPRLATGIDVNVRFRQ